MCQSRIQVVLEGWGGLPGETSVQEGEGFLTKQRMLPAYRNEHFQLLGTREQIFEHTPFPPSRFARFSNSPQPGWNTPGTKTMSRRTHGAMLDDT